MNVTTPAFPYHQIDNPNVKRLAALMQSGLEIGYEAFSVACKAGLKGVDRLLPEATYPLQHRIDWQRAVLTYVCYRNRHPHLSKRQTDQVLLSLARLLTDSEPQTGSSRKLEQIDRELEDLFQILR